MPEATNPITTASNPRVGEDWVLVPRRATPEMLGAFWRTKNTGTLGIGGEYQDSSDMAAYRAMIASAPSPEAGAGGDLVELERLNAAATQGAYAEADDGHGRFGVLDRGNLEEVGEALPWDTRFIVALVNAYRSGKLVASRGSGEETKGADWLDRPIGGELIFDGMRFGKGVPLRTVIKAAQRWRRDAVAAFNEKVEARRPAERDHVVSARRIPWEPGSLGGVDLTFESGLRVALPLSEPEATPKSSPSQTPVDAQMTVEEAREAFARQRAAADRDFDEDLMPGGFN